MSIRYLLQTAMISLVAAAATMVAYDRFSVRPKLAATPKLAVVDMGAIYKIVQNRVADDVIAKNKELGPEAAAKVLAQGLDSRLSERVGVYVDEVANTCDCVLLAKGGVMYGATLKLPDYTQVILKKMGL